MNNKLIALAIAGALTAPMMAVEAAPTAYGRLAVELAQTSNSETGVADQDVAVDNKAGQFGFKGSEDLGGGLKAIYKAEFGLETSNNGGVSIFDREKFVGLKIGKQHEIQLGNLKSAYKYGGGVKYDSFAATTMQARFGSTNIKDAAVSTTSLSGGAMSSGAYGHGGFLQNSVAYIGKFKPVTVWLTHSMDDSLTTASSGTAGQLRANSVAGDVTSLGVSAKVSSFHFGVATISKDGCDDQVATSNCGATTVGAGNVQEVDQIESTKFFGSWSKGQHTVRAQIETVEKTRGRASATANESKSFDTDYMYLNYQFKMGKHLVDVAIGEKDDTRAASGSDLDWSRVAYAYNFSKKTRVFAGVAANEETNNTGTSNNTNANDWDTFSIGMQVKF